MERIASWKYTSRMSVAHSGFLCTLLVLLAGCATTGEGGGTSPVREDVTAADRPVSPPAWPKVSVESPQSNLLDVVAQIGSRYDVGYSLMQGIGLRPLAGMEHQDVGYVSLMESLAQDTACVVEKTPYYLFVYPPGYDDLERINLYDRIPNVWRGRALSVVFDGNRKLNTVLAFLGDGLGKTIVADNLVADASIGAVRVPYAPVPDVLNAVLKSARMAPDAFDVDASEDYIFIHRRGSGGLSTAFVGASNEALPTGRVSIALPEGSVRGEKFRPVEGATPFGDLLGAISRQIGLSVTADASLHALPVNQTVIRDLPLQTALDLIVRQWPVDGIGYTFSGDAVHFQRTR